MGKEASKIMPFNSKLSGLNCNFDITNYTAAFEYLNRTPRILQPTSWVGHIPFAFFAMEILRPKTLVELGVYVGNSFCAFCQAKQSLNLDTKCYGVDSWHGDDHAREPTLSHRRVGGPRGHRRRFHLAPRLATLIGER